MTSDGHESAGDDPLGRLLVRQAEQISQLRNDLTALANETADTVADLHEQLNDARRNQSTSAGSLPAAWCWKHLDADSAEQLKRELAEWVTWLRSRYPLARRIPTCWAEHPETIEELTALWLAWRAAYTEIDAPLTGAIVWHDRWLPGLLHRLEHGPFALNCTDTHQPRPTQLYAD